MLTDPYYVRHADVQDATREVSRRYYDFAVRYGDLLFDPTAVDATRTHIAPETQEVTVAAPVPVGTDCVAGALWARVIRGAHGLLVSLVDLSSQSDVLWKTPKRPPRPLADVRLRIQQTAPTSIRFASPESSPSLQRLEPEPNGRHDVVTLPPFSTWGLVWVSDEEVV